MTEKEKMLAGGPYNSRDPELLETYHRAKELLAQFHSAPSRESGLKFSLLKQLFGYCGEGVWVEGCFSCDYGENISVGKNTFINYNCVFIDDNLITIGENVLIAPAVQIYTATHPTAPALRIGAGKPGTAPYTTLTSPVTIGNNVWIGGGAVICPGVEIGDNAVIGAGSVVTRSVSPNCVAAGNPCKVIRTVE